MFQFTHPGRGATALRSQVENLEEFQFTHPGRGATIITTNLTWEGIKVSIHAPREGCDATISGIEALELRQVSIHAPREGCDHKLVHKRKRGDVSIHAPREGCDHNCGIASCNLRRFNSRTPGGVRLAIEQEYYPFCHRVSIHAPREGCD